MKTFYNNGVIQVTDSFLNYSGKTIEISNITMTQVSYRDEKTQNSLLLIKRVMYTTLFFGFFYSMYTLKTLITSKKNFIEYTMAFLVIITYSMLVGIYFKKKVFFKSIKKTERQFSLTINSTHGTIEAYTTKDEEAAYQVNSAIMNAMSERRFA